MDPYMAPCIRDGRLESVVTPAPSTYPVPSEFPDGLECGVQARRSRPHASTLPHESAPRSQGQSTPSATAKALLRRSIIPKPPSNLEMGHPRRFRHLDFNLTVLPV